MFDPLLLELNTDNVVILFVYSDKDQFEKFSSKRHDAITTVTVSCAKTVIK